MIPVSDYDKADLTLFIVAGPAGLAADVRRALRSNLAGPKAVLKGGPDVTLHVETYGIAVSIS